MSDSLDGMPDGLTINPSDGIDIRKSLRDLAKRDAKLSREMEIQLKSIEKERAQVRKQIERERKLIMQSQLSSEETASSLLKLEDILADETHRIDGAIEEFGDTLNDTLGDFENRRYEYMRTIETAKSKKRKEFYDGTRKSIVDAITESFGTALSTTADTMLGPLKLIVRPLEELTGVSLKDTVSRIIGKRQEARENYRDTISSFSSSYVAPDRMPKTRRPALDEDERPELEAPPERVLIPDNLNVDRLLVVAKAVAVRESEHAYANLMPAQSISPIARDAGASRISSSPMPLLLPAPESMRGGQEENEKVLDLFAPGKTMQPRRQTLVQSGIVGSAAAYIGDVIEAKFSEDSGKKEDDSALKNGILGNLGGSLLSSLAQSLIPALVTILPAVLGAAAVTAVIAMIVSDTAKRNKERDEILAGLSDKDREALAKKNIKAEDIVTLEQAKAAQALTSGRASAIDLNKTGAVEQLANAGGKTGAAIAAEVFAQQGATAGNAIEQLGDFTKGGFFFWLDKSGQMWAAKDPARGVRINPLNDAQKQRIVRSWAMAHPKDRLLEKDPRSTGNFLIGDPEKSVALFDQLIVSGGKPIKFNRGGIVPGPIGDPKIVQAEGGEAFVPTHDARFRENLDLLLDSDLHGKVRSHTSLDQAVIDALRETKPIEIDDSFNDKVVEAIEVLTSVVKQLASARTIARATETVNEINFDAFRHKR